MNIEYTGLEIAVIGMSCRFPGANNINEFWSNLKNGVESLEFLTEKELENIDQKIKDNPFYVRAKGGIIKDIYSFDEQYFNYNPNEVEVMNPQNRLIHELILEALEDAGCNSYNFNKKISLFASGSSSTNWEMLINQSEISNQIGQFNSVLFSRIDYLATRIAYKFNLKGQSVFISTACSSSLVAIHLACRSLLAGECNMALAAGSSLSILPQDGYIYQKDMIFSSDGHCRAFDESADGTVRGQGGGVIVLKLLDDAIKDRDHIYAIIKGTATNNDGCQKIGYTAPSVEAQADVVKNAMLFGEVEPSTISFVETHGTGTNLGDPIEIEALKLAFNTKEKNFCGIGSVKTNIGHLDNASGIAGFIKTVLAIKNKTIPPTLNFKNPNHKIDFENSPFYVNCELKDIIDKKESIRAGVSSFGIGGTNAHVVLEEFNQEKKHSLSRNNHLILLSAKSEKSLDMATLQIQKYISVNKDVNLPDLSYTLQIGRGNYEYKRIIVSSSIQELRETLNNENSKGIQTFYTENIKKDLAFVFCGIGSQYRNLGEQLYKSEKVFSDEVNTCISFIDKQYNIDCKKLLFSSDNFNSLIDIRENIEDFEESQLVTFIIEYALAKLLIYWGILPNVLIGYSFGEYVAACIAEIYTLEDALTLIIERGKLIKKINYGKMLSIPLSQELVLPYLDNRISVAIDNGISCIVGGLPDDISEFHSKMKNEGFLCMEVNNPYAIHTHLMKPIIQDFREILRNIKFQQPKYPIISNLTGSFIESEKIACPEYWLDHLCNKVKFSEGIAKLLENDNLAIIEIGAGRSLCNIIDQISPRKKGQHLINTLPAKQERQADDKYFLKKIGQLWLYGVEINWTKYYENEERYKLSLPTYPFARSKFDRVINEYLQKDNSINTKEISREEDIANWFYVPIWKRTVNSLNNYKLLENKNEKWLFFTDNNKKWSFLFNDLNLLPIEIIKVVKGDSYVKLDKNNYVFNHLNIDNYKYLFTSLNNDNLIPDRIIYIWDVNQSEDAQLTKSYFEACQYNGLYSVLHLIKNITNYNIKNLKINILTSNVFQVNGLENIDPSKSTIIGSINSIHQEYPFIKCTIIDVESLKNKNLILKWIKSDIANDTRENFVAYRNNFRWIKEYQQFRLEAYDITKIPLKKNGVYIITGGLGKIGQSIAKYLGYNYHAKIILTGRNKFPEMRMWEDIISSESEDVWVKKSINVFQSIINCGGKLIIKDIDVTDEEGMISFISEVEDKWGKIDGVIHAAGNMIGGSFQKAINQTTIIDLNEQFVSKVYGTNVLYNIFKEKNPDFVLLISSLSSILGGIGFYSYAAASNYLDSVSQLLFHKGVKNWISVNWADWSFRTLNNNEIGDFKSAYSINPEDGIKTFERVLGNLDINQIVVSAGSLSERIKKWVSLENFNENISQKSKIIKRKKPILLTKSILPETELEKQLTTYWEDFFGYSELGIYDNFFELGGDSLKALMILSKIHKEFNVIIPLSEFFNDPTIYNCAFIIAEHKNKKKILYKSCEKREYYPLSSSQMGIYSFQQINEGSTAYNEPRIIKLKKGITLSDIEYVINLIISRHDALRLSITNIDGRIVQKVNNAISININHIKCNEENIEKVIEELVMPFCFSIAPLFRAKMIEINDECYLFFDIHHIIADGVSISNLLKEVRFLLEGKKIDVIQYSFMDFCINQNEREVSNKLQKVFWLNQFQNGIPKLELPFDYPENKGEISIEEYIQLTINKKDTEAIKEHCRINKITMFSFMNSVLYILLNKITGEKYISIGSVVSGRDQYPKSLPVIGMFISTLPLVINVKEKSTFDAFSKEVHENNFNSYKNLDIQLDDLIKLIVKERFCGENPLFNVMISSEADFEEKTQIGNNKEDILKLTAYPFSGHKMARFEFNLMFSMNDEELKFSFKYNSKLFKRSTIERMVKYFNQIILTVIDTPLICIDNIELINDFEKKALLESINAGKKNNDYLIANYKDNGLKEFSFE
ncbi:MAG: hypothetical protein A2X00_10635 [Bacteroidetes bacterium GWE2_32_14]|nr:MAG: hypothetical protein A2X00_10635 [Bacteroidetes bacterium GWE2_32_14]